MTPDRAVWRRILAPLAVSRGLMVAGILFAIWFGTATPGTGLLGALHGLFDSWDGKAYIRIADVGYSTEADPRYLAQVVAHGYSTGLNADDAFLPAYPIVVRVFGWVTHDFVVAGLLVSLLCEAAGLYYIYRFVEQERDAGSASFVVWATALAPFGFFFGAVYTESMFIAATAAALYHMRAGRFGPAALATMLACATRITGVAVMLALGIEYLRQNGLRWKPDVLWLLLTPLPFIAFATYMYFHVGDALALLHANSIYFNHDFATPWDGLRLTWHTFMGESPGPDRFTWFREILFGLLGVGACVVAWAVPKFPRSLATYCSVVMLMAICISFWRSVPRYELALFPLALLVADVTSRERAARGVIIGMTAAFFTLGTAIYAQGWLA